MTRKHQTTFNKDLADQTNPQNEAAASQPADSPANLLGPPPAGVDSATLDKVTLMSVSNVPADVIARTCAEKFQMTDDLAQQAIIAAQRRILLAACYHRNAETGRAILRLNDLYGRALKVQDAKTALAVQREINNLLGLYASGAGGQSGDKPAQPGQPDSSEGLRGEPGVPPDVQALYDAIDCDLEPLLAVDDDADYPTRIRQAAALIRKLRKTKESHR